ncbi:MAG: NAD(P)-binding domain-containing protein [Actinomycetota bacterium]
MPTLGLIGSGHIGGTVARLAIGAGYEVILSNSRGPETLKGLVQALGPLAQAATPAEAAQGADLVVVTIPLKAYAQLPPAPLAGKVVIDTNNYYPGRDGQIPELDDHSATSSGLLQRHLAGAKVVKGFNNIYYEHLRDLARPAGAPDRSALPIAGDDAAAKDSVAAFFDAIGYDTVDVGPLEEGWRCQPDQPVYGVVYIAPGRSDLSRSAAVPADAAKVRAALAAARR